MHPWRQSTAGFQSGHLVEPVRQACGGGWLSPRARGIVKRTRHRRTRLRAEPRAVRLSEARRLGCLSVKLEEGLDHCRIVVIVASTEGVLAGCRLRQAGPGAVCLNGGCSNREMDIDWHYGQRQRMRADLERFDPVGADTKAMAQQPAECPRPRSPDGVSRVAPVSSAAQRPAPDQQPVGRELIQHVLAGLQALRLVLVGDDGIQAPVAGETAKRLLQKVPTRQTWWRQLGCSQNSRRGAWRQPGCYHQPTRPSLVPIAHRFP